MRYGARGAASINQSINQSNNQTNKKIVTTAGQNTRVIHAFEERKVTTYISDRASKSATPSLKLERLVGADDTSSKMPTNSTRAACLTCCSSSFILKWKAAAQEEDEDTKSSRACTTGEVDWTKRGRYDTCTQVGRSASRQRSRKKTRARPSWAVPRQFLTTKYVFRVLLYDLIPIFSEERRRRRTDNTSYFTQQWRTTPVSQSTATPGGARSSPTCRRTAMPTSASPSVWD